jgi:uncharacterized protein involved in outer membrane biogenesis
VSDGRFIAVRKKLLIAGGALACLILLAVVAWPHFSDASSFKPRIIAAVKQATGRDLVIDGPARLALLPSPRIIADNVRFANAAGAANAQMFDINSVSISPVWLALLVGRIEIGELTLVQPAVVLEPDANGKPNWDFASATSGAGAADGGFALHVGRLNVEDGKLSYLDPKQGIAVTAENLNVTGSIGSPVGPFGFVGSAVVNGTVLKFDVSVGALVRNGEDTQGSYKATVSLQTDTGSLRFDGTTDALAPGAHVVGQLSVATGSLPDFIIALVRATGQQAPPAQAGLTGRFTFDGGIDVSAGKIAVNDFKMALDGDQSAGSIALTLAPALALEGKISLPKLDIDRWLAAPAQPAAVQPNASKVPAAPAAAAKTPAPAPTAKAPTPAPAPLPTVLSALLPPEIRTALPANATINLTLEVAEATYNKAGVKNASIVFDLRKGVLTIPTLAATLPGDMVLQAHAASTGDAAHPLLAGELSLAGPRLRQTLDWLQIDVDSVPAGRLNQFALQAKLAANGPNLQLTDATFQLDDFKGTGGATMTVSAQTAAISNVALQAGLDTFDVDAYLPPTVVNPPGMVPGATTPTRTTGAATTTPAALSPPPPAAPPLPASFNVGLKAKIAKLIYRKQTLSGVDADLTLAGSTLKLNDMKIADLLGAKAAFHGSVTDLTSVPRFDLVASVSTPAADTLLPLIGVLSPFKGKIGALTASGGVAGTASALSLNGFHATLLGASVTAAGTVTLAPAMQFNFSEFSLQAPDVSGLVAAATGKAAAAGPVALNGALSGSLASVTFKGGIQAHDTAMDGSIGATLGSRPNITLDLRVPGTLDFDKWLGIGGAPAARAAPSASGASAAAATPIDPAPLRAFDASIKLSTSVLTLSPLRVTYGDLSATLKNGILTVNKLTGQFYGGAVDFSGMVNATGPALALDFKGSVRGIYLGELLRSTATTNRFGSSLTVSLNGEILATDIEIKGAGSSSDEIRNSLSGGASIGGYIYAAVDKGMVTLGVIGASLTGMDAAALVLRQFVNRRNDLSGRVDIAANLVRTETLTVQGQDMAAHVASTTSVLVGTTDTTIVFVTPDNKSSLFTTVKGPLSAPAMDDNSVRAAPWQGFPKPAAPNQGNR